jgi:hypothetical protein
VASAATVHLVVIGAVPVVIGAVVSGRRRGWSAAARRLAATTLVATAITAAWLVPDLATRGDLLGTAGGRDAVVTFASGGPLLTLWLRALGGAAFWRPLPPGSLTFVGVVIAVAWVLTTLVKRHGQGHARAARHLLAGCAAVAAVAVYLSHGPFTALWSRLAVGFWPAGLLREPGKLVMLALAAPIAGAAAASQRWADGVRRRRVRPGHVAALPVLGAVVAAFASLVFTTGMLTPSQFPREWALARAAVDVDRCRIAVLGDGAYVDPGFTGGRVVANPAREYFGPRAIVSDDSGVAGLDPRPPQAPAGRWAADVNARYIGAGGPAPKVSSASAVGIGWVFVDRPVDRTQLTAELDRAGFERVVRSDRAGLWRTPGGCS